MTIIKTSALVLKSIDWRDSSKIVTLFTREIGRVDVIVKGAKLKKRLTSGIIESMNMIEVLIYFSKRRELQILGSTTLENSFFGIRSDLDRTSCALCMIELILIFFRPGYVDQIFFDFFISLFSQLNHANRPIVILFYFLLKFSSYLGFKPEFNKCRKCNTEIEQSSTFFNFKEGSVICNKCIKPEGRGIWLSELDQEYLILLQNTGYKLVSHLQNPKNINFSYQKFLIDYLNFHTEHQIQLNALKLIFKSINTNRN